MAIMKHHNHQPELMIVSIEWVETPDAKQRLAKVFDILLREPVAAGLDQGLICLAAIRPMRDINTSKGESQNDQERTH